MHAGQAFTAGLPWLVASFFSPLGTYCLATTTTTCRLPSAEVARAQSGRCDLAKPRIQERCRVLAPADFTKERAVGFGRYEIESNRDISPRTCGRVCPRQTLRPLRSLPVLSRYTMMALRGLLRGALAQAERTALGAAFSTQAPQDYSLAMKQAAEIAKIEKPTANEVGLVAGVPEESFKRPVSATAREARPCGWLCAGAGVQQGAVGVRMGL
jgi:hypothetical protein